MQKNREIPFGDLRRHYEAIKPEIDAAVQRVLNSGWFILGAELEAFEKRFAAHLGIEHAVGVGSGTEALHLALLAAGVMPGDEVITVANTAVPTLSAISFAQATPVFVEIDPSTYCMDAQKIEAAITRRTRAIVPVHLYGHPCDMPAIMEIARRNSLQVIEDCAQSHDAMIGGRKTGTFGDYGCFSFYPSKNLGAFGDAGLIVTHDNAAAERLTKLRNYGQSRRYYHDSIGFNSRLDEMQAAILSTKLTFLPKWTERRRQIAALFNLLIKNPRVIKPSESAGCTHVYHLYVIRNPKRDDLRQYLAEHGVSTQIHYPVPCHLQKAYANLGLKPGLLPISETYAEQVLSLPNYPELGDDEIEYICRVINQFE
jgi:dTDP-4-amino-4,6-dideoxygalactose transaminase